jgi:redox-sensitive bicupin YhaK (pirin superfamily)
MSKRRIVKQVFSSIPTLEGAGVHLKRAFGYHQVPLLVSGKPLGEPVAWQGPIVMNTDEELATAFKEFSNGTFLKHSR